MDRPRGAGAPRDRGQRLAGSVRRDGGRLTIRHTALATACALAVIGGGTGCTGVTADANAPIAIEFVLDGNPPIPVQEFDTVPLHVRVLDRAGDSIVGAKVSIVSLNPDTVGVDTTRLAVFGITPGSGSVVAFTGALTSTPLRVTVSRAPDSLAVDSVAVDTVPAGDTVSAPLAALLLDLRTTPGTPIGLAYDTVQFAIVLPVFASDSTATAVLGNDSLSAAVVTGTAPLGQAEVVVKRRGPPPQPDSVVVQARAYRANGAEVHGSPLRFVVYFQ